MQNRKVLREEIELVNTLKVISQAYEEISVMRMQKIRDSVLKTRDFLVRLSGVFYDVKRSHRRFLRIMQNELGDLAPYDILPHNGKKITVMLTANERMNGDILSKVFKAFVSYIRGDGKGTDLLLIGKIGKEMYSQYDDIPKDFTYLQIPDDKVRLQDVKQIIKLLVQYQEINVFYGKFQSVVTQDAVISNITGDKPFEGIDLSESKDTELPDKRYIYEPSLEELYEFFETQFFSALFKQTIDESHLSRYASRINAMEEALGNISAKSKRLLSEERKTKKAIQNKKQNDSIAGMGQWG
jgi:F-type H+-transporting ATPase subunit gamma